MVGTIREEPIPGRDILLNEIKERFRSKLNDIYATTVLKIAQVKRDSLQKFKETTKKEFDEMMAQCEQIKDEKKRRMKQQEMWQSWHMVSIFHVSDQKNFNGYGRLIDVCDCCIHLDRTK